MESAPKFIVSTTMMAKGVGASIAIGIGSYECWMMMLGRRGIDVMKILRIIIISLCITSTGIICNVISAPGKALEQSAKASAEGSNKQVAAMEKKVAESQAKYLEKLRAVQDSIAQAQKIEKLGEDADWYEELIYSVSSLGDTINNYAQRAAVAAETKISEWINDVIRFVGMIIFQMSLYGILVAQRVFMALLEGFAPLMFAISLAPPYKSAWSQWMSKYISLSLWGMVAYAILYYVDYILLYNLQQDIAAYSTLLGGTVNSWEQIGALGLQGIGSNCMYVMGMLVGAYVLRYTPEAASWLMPGGVSSGIGQQAGSLVTSATRTAATTSTGVAGTAAGWAGSQAKQNLNWGDNYSSGIKNK